MSLNAISNLSRGIFFTACTDPPTEANLASVRIIPKTGMEQQLWDTGTSQLDTYWLYKVSPPS